MTKYPSDKEEKDNKTLASTLKVICDLRLLIEQMVDNWGGEIPAEATNISKEEKKHRKEATAFFAMASQRAEDDRKREISETRIQLLELNNKLKKLEKGSK